MTLHNRKTVEARVRGSEIQQRPVACSFSFQYLLHYLKSLHDWLDPDTVKNVPIAKTAFAILRDSYHSDLSLRFQAEHIAVAVLYLALQIYGVDVPYSNKAQKKWWEVSFALIEPEVS